MRSSIQDVGALFIGGLVFITMLVLSARISNTAFTQTMTTTIHEGNTSSTQVVEYEFRTMGFGVGDSNVVLAANPAGITFRSDLGANGTVDTVGYATGPADASGRFSLIRTVAANGVQTSMPVANSISQFTMSYRDRTGNIATTLRSIRSITISMLMQGDAAVDEPATGVYWERTFKPNNLR